MSSSELKRLLDVLHERGIALEQDDVAWAFDSPKTREETESWVREYLGTATLLTTEELSLYVSCLKLPALLQRTGILIWLISIF